jgi:hypothetical protein
MRIFCLWVFFLCAATSFGCGEDCSEDASVCTTSNCKFCNGFVCESCCNFPSLCPEDDGCTLDGGSGECRNEPSTVCALEIPEVPTHGNSWLMLLGIPLLLLIPFGARRILAKRADSKK